eukprot:16287931-Heterocapsa_arctica.AAC.1
MFSKVCNIKCAQPRHECCVVTMTAMIEQLFEHRPTSWNEPGTEHAGQGVATHRPQTSRTHHANARKQNVSKRQMKVQPVFIQRVVV